MEIGWVKLHRKLLNNKMWRRDITASHVFVTLLLLVDKKTGRYDCGRFQLAEITGLKATTAYNALKRLEKAKMLTQSSNNKFTDISICNWNQYQAVVDTSNDNRMTTNRQQNDNKMTLNKNKELRIKNIYNADSKKRKSQDKREAEAPTKQKIREMLKQGKTFKEIATNL